MRHRMASVLSVEGPLNAETIHESLAEACRLPFGKGVRIVGSTEKTIRVEVSRHNNTGKDVKLCASAQADGSMLVYRRKEN